MKSFITMILSYAIMGIAISTVMRMMFKSLTRDFDKYLEEKFNGILDKDIYLEENINTRLTKICKAERRQKSDQINMILDEWMTEYEKKI